MAEKRITKMSTPHGKKISGEDLRFTSIKEGWSEYELEDGAIVRIRVVAQKISRGLTPDEGIYYKDDGEPLYNVQFNVAVAAEVPKSLIKE